MANNIKWEHLPLDQQRVLAAIVMSRISQNGATRFSIGSYLNDYTDNEHNIVDVEEMLVLLKDHGFVKEAQEEGTGKPAGIFNLTAEGEEVLYQMLRNFPVVKGYEDYHITRALNAANTGAPQAWNRLTGYLMEEDGMDVRYRPAGLPLISPNAAIKINSLDVSASAPQKPAEYDDFSPETKTEAAWRRVHKGLANLMEFKEKLEPRSLDMKDPETRRHVEELVDAIVGGRIHELNTRIKTLEGQVASLQEQLNNQREKTGFRASISSASTKPLGTER